jgi:dihydrofolate reductase
MGRVVAAEYVSVDGRMEMEDPQGKEEQVGGWTAPYWNEELQAQQYEQLFASDALLLGRVTYQGFAASWPGIGDEEGFADRMNSLPKYVASRTLTEPLEWNASLLHGDAVEEVRGLKQHAGDDLLIYGSGELVRSLLPHDLIDELRLMIHPVLLGWGKRLLERVDRSGLTLTDTRATGTGVVTLTYQVAGRWVPLTPRRPRSGRSAHESARAMAVTTMPRARGA